MAKKDREQSAASADDVLAAYERLSTADLVRLRAYAELRVRIAGRAALGDREDLLNEALTRTLDGRRQWKKDISLTIFLIGVMRSISSNDWIAPFEKYGKYVLRDADLVVREEDGLEDSVIEQAKSHVASPEDGALANEDAAIYRGAMESLKEHFAGDRSTLDVIDGIMAGFTGPEIKELAGIEQKEFESTMKALRRAGSKLFGSFDDIGKDSSRGH